MKAQLKQDQVHIKFGVLLKKDSDKKCTCSPQLRKRCDFIYRFIYFSNSI